MLKYNLGLLAGSATIFACSLGFASLHYDQAPDPTSSTQTTRKNGDMLIYYYGRRAGYRQGGLSGRGGSLNNRAYRGGGIRGGK